MKKTLILISSVCALLFAFLAIGCTGCVNKGDNGGAHGNLVDFSDTSTTIEVGDRYVPDYTTVKDVDGNEYPLTIRVYNSNNTEVGSTDGGFKATDFGGYTVKYTAKIDGKEYVRSVSVGVTDTTAPKLKFLDLRSERQVGTIPYPQVFVSDNSGEKLNYELQILPENGQSDGVVRGEDGITFTKAGTYKFVAAATDSHGNAGKCEKEVSITESMGYNVWENFDNEKHMETVKNTSFLTSETKAEWLAEFEGKSGVAKIQPNYARYYNNNFFVQLGLPKTREEILACDWRSFTIKLYLDVKGADSVTLSNGDGIKFGEYKTKQWVDFRVERNAYIVKANNYAFPALLGDEDYDTRSEAFALAVTQEIPRPTFSVSVYKLLSSIDVSDVTIYIDEITWKEWTPDITPPEISAAGPLKVQVNEEYTLPEFIAIDEKDGEVNIESVTLYDESETNEIEVVDNKVTFTEVGRYILVVTAKDGKGNRAVKKYGVKVLEYLDEKILATYDYEDELGVLGLLNGKDISWAESFTDKDGVTKNGVMKLKFDGNDQADHITLNLTAETLAKMKSANFDYIDLTICINNDSGYNNSYKNNVYSLYSWLKSFPEYSSSSAPECRKWETIRISLKDLSNKSYLSFNNTLTVAETRNEFCTYFQYNEQKLFFYLSSWFAEQTVEMYVDSVEWGVYPPDTAAPEISASGSLKAEVNKEYTLPSFSATDDRDGAVEIESVKLFDETETTQIPVVNGKVTFTGLGKYVIVVTAKDSAGNIATKKYTVKVVTVLDEKVLATYDYADELGVLGLYSGSGISWVESFTDKDGVSKNGLMKLTLNGNAGAEVVTLKLSQDMIAKMKAANFDYIEMVICVNNDSNYNYAKNNVYSLYSFNKSIPDYSSSAALECKKWQTVRISLADLCAAGSYVSGSDSLTQDKAREKFLSYYGESNSLFFNLSSWFQGQAVELYIDSVVWGV